MKHSKWYWVAGASSGIGFAIAKEMAHQGASLILSSRSLKNLERAKHEISSKQEVLLCPLELGDPHTRQKVAEFCEQIPFPLAGALINGGGPHGGNFNSLEAKDLEEAHKLLFLGPALLLQALFPYLSKPGSSIVAITSTTVKESNQHLPLSGAYRSALVSLLKTLSLDWGKAHGIRVNNVAPGYTSTQRLDELANYVSKNSGHSKSEIEKTWSELAALGRIGSPAEVAKAAGFLLGEDSSFVTGQTLVVDGGQLKQY